MTTVDGGRIDFFLIGPQKCGTTTYHDALRRHPDIVLPTSTDNSLLVDTALNHFTDEEFSEYFTPHDERPPIILGRDFGQWR